MDARHQRIGTDRRGLLLSGIFRSAQSSPNTGFNIKTSSTRSANGQSGKLATRHTLCPQQKRGRRRRVSIARHLPACESLCWDVNHRAALSSTPLTNLYCLSAKGFRQFNRSVDGHFIARSHRRVLTAQTTQYAARFLLTCPSSSLQAGQIRFH